MGRTVPAFRPALEGEISSWDDFRRGLRHDDREIFDSIMQFPRIHADAGSLAARPDLSQLVFMSILLELKKENIALSKEIENLKKRLQKDDSD